VRERSATGQRVLTASLLFAARPIFQCLKLWEHRRLPNRSSRWTLAARSLSQALRLSHWVVPERLAGECARLSGQRLARWLSYVAGRSAPCRCSVTHEFVALLLGIRRQGVTTALHEPEAKRLIKSARGSVKILDGDGQRTMTSAFYGVPEADTTI
jgi:hypothetical protein